MTKLTRYLTNMSLFVGAVLAFAFVMFEPLIGAFLANAALNGVIVAVLIFGVAFVYRQVITLKGEIAWVEAQKQPDPEAPIPAAPVLLAPMAALIGDKGGVMKLSATSTRVLLDSLASRLDEAREVARYLMGLLIFLGLLGTFWGLLGTIGAIGQTIQSLSVSGGDISLMFDDLKRGLEAPLSGMGTAFSSSLFGLGGSVTLGFLDLQAGQAMNRFYNDLENWLSEKSKLTPAVAEGGEGASAPAYLAALIEQSADNMDKLQRTMARSDEGRGASSAALTTLAEQLAGLVDQMKVSQQLMQKIGEGQVELGNSVRKMAQSQGNVQPALDDATKTHLRNMDVHLKSLLEQSQQGNDDVVDTLKSEMRVLARTISTLAEKK